MAFIWDVPTDLDPLPTYRLRFTISSNADEEHISGPFRLQSGKGEPLHWYFPLKTVQDGWMIYVLALVGVAIVGLLAAGMIWGRRQRDGLIMLAETD